MSATAKCADRWVTWHWPTNAEEAREWRARFTEITNAGLHFRVDKSGISISMADGTQLEEARAWIDERVAGRLKRQHRRKASQ